MNQPVSKPTIESDEEVIFINEEEDELIFVDEELELNSQSEARPWKVIIVDDELSVHQATK